MDIKIFRIVIPAKAGIQKIRFYLFYINKKLRKQNEKIFKTKYWKRWRILYSIKIVSREFYSNNNIGQSGKI
ncbi:hypothetical protein A3I35_04120 [Candidatus Falkowbacteria bacterium RIFCSPLOWO2_02_FULL_45_15]|uniref:Uncharacterized protein n=1 Tax=Candidatus Falkowbacteria bacterium RIFCSPLOWO2_02_FULL_45_15 TaxID=1797988 RepID=A0A1F5RYI3_9BACT|nr:MAG: hypothetical protein A3I35_04120 [Candidatus Falkowbacteria bacterium RIFCSPLOWO2_02_FULL_45_15]